MAERKKDYISASLDEFIHERPGSALRDIKKKGLGIPKHISQQWRLGRNGVSRPPLKRLGRGQLRPLIRGSNWGPRLNNGMPQLVLKRRRFLRPDSVFHRLGWNVAWQKAQRARRFFWRQPIIRYAGNRRFPMYYQQPRRYPVPQWRYQRPRFYHRRRPAATYHNDDQEQCRKMIQAERYRIQRMKLDQLQRNSQDFQPGYSQNFGFQGESRLPDDLASASAASRFPIARDDYVPLSSARPPSPAGSIISAFARNRGQTSQSQGFSQENPFACLLQPKAAPQAQSQQTSYQGNSGFRTPYETNVPTQRYTPQFGNGTIVSMMD